MASSARLSARPAPPESFRSPTASDTATLSDTARRSAGAVAAATAALGKPQVLGVATPAPAPPTSRSAATTKRDGFFYVPASYNPCRPSPLVVMLHGAGGRASPSDTYMTLGGLDRMEGSSCILVVPESRGTSWDVIRGGFGADVTHIDRALTKVLASYAVDPNRIALSGFSDGASYALSLGLANPDLFTHIVAFSPGFMRPPTLGATAQGSGARLAVFVSHGLGDEMLPVACSRRIVPRLREAGYRVEYREFAGGHVIPPHIAEDGLQWFLQAGA